MFSCHERGSGPAKQINDNAVLLRGVPHRIGDEGQTFRGRMKLRLRRSVKLPDGCLFPVAIELMPGCILERVDDRFMPHLVVHSADDQRVFHPDAGCGVMKSCVHYGIVEVDLFSIRVKHIQRSAIRQMLIDVLHSG
ncbi:hypothetical protein SDC9_179164 [bioreactor metagenome]|uniref:Uncharacterized protein n=1 Tax=bioreactor metagenome TaxID=1076179 RepID=A0A645GZ56_9ZZZZ